MATRYNFRCSSCGEEFDRTDIDCPYCGSYESHDTIYEIELVAELEKERERREKAEAVVRYYEELLVSPFDPRILALDDAGYAKIPSPQRVRDIISERDRLQAKVRELENSFFCPHCNAKFPTTADGAIEALEHEQTCKQSPIVQERDALRAENARLWEALVFARDFIMSGPRPGDEMMAVQRISAALEPAGGEEMTGIERIAAERRRKIEEEGWTPEPVDSPEVGR